MRLRAYQFLPLLGLALLSGCGQSALAPVHGRVTCNGKPVPQAGVIFSPAGQSESDRQPGKAAAGSTDADGRYVLTTYRPGDGALVGQHHVSIIVDNAVRLPCGCTMVLVVEVKP